MQFRTNKDLLGLRQSLLSRSGSFNERASVTLGIFGFTVFLTQAPPTARAGLPDLYLLAFSSGKFPGWKGHWTANVEDTTMDRRKLGHACH